MARIQKIKLPDKHLIAVDLWSRETRNYAPVGVIAYDQRQRVGGFQYRPDYDGPALDPVNLDYQRAGFRFQLPEGQSLHGAFRDQLPGANAQLLIQAKIPGFVGFSDAAKLTVLGEHSSGALRFRPQGAPVVAERPVRGMRALDRLIRGELEIIRGGYGDPAPLAEIAWYSATYVRGQRPKALYMNPHGAQFIAKFGRPDDPFRIEKVESVMLSMARDAGIDSVPTVLDTTPAGHDVLFSSRFDVDHEGNRYHRLSLAALTGIEQPGEGDFLDILKMIRRISANPEADARELFRRMVLHNAVNNTDNHFRNFDMLLKEEGWRLAPAYDIVPDPARHPFATTLCGRATQDLSLDFLREAGQHFEIPGEEAMQIAREVLEVVAKRGAYFEAAGLSLRDQRIVNQAIPVSDILALLERMPASPSGPEIAFGI